MKKLIQIIIRAAAHVGGAMLGVWGLATLSTGCYRLGKRDAERELMAAKEE